MRSTSEILNSKKKYGMREITKMVNVDESFRY